MLETIDWKLVAAVVSPALGIIGFIPYFYGIYKGTTKPHVFTWLIWTLTLGIANLSIWTGGGGLVLSIGIAVSVVLSFITMLLSIKYGTRNITRSDMIALIVALVAIGVWIGLDNPVLALLLATSIDIVGYWPTFRKSFIEPWSEALSSWILYTAAPALTLFSLLEYNVLTMTYSAATLIINGLLVALLLVRRQGVQRT